MFAATVMATATTVDTKKLEAHAGFVVSMVVTKRYTSC